MWFLLFLICLVCIVRSVYWISLCILVMKPTIYYSVITLNFLIRQLIFISSLYILVNWKRAFVASRVTRGAACRCSKETNSINCITAQINSFVTCVTKASFRMVNWKIIIVFKNQPLYLLLIFLEYLKHAHCSEIAKKEFEGCANRYKETMVFLKPNKNQESHENITLNENIKTICWCVDVKICK